MSHPAFRAFRVLLTVGAIIAIGAAFVATVDDVRELQLPGVGSLVASGTLVAISLGAAAIAWSVLLPDGIGLGSSLPGFALAQLAKYIPGTVWQGVGQVTDAKRLGSPLGTASVAYACQLAIQCAVAGAASALALLNTELPPGLRLVAVAGPLGLLLLHRRWIQVALSLLGRWVRRIDPRGIGIPHQRGIFQAAACSTVTIFALGASFAVLLPAGGEPRRFVAIAGVFILSWFVGFLVVPLPSGLGVREGILVIGLAPWYATADILAAAVIVRMVTIVVEALFALGGQAARIERPHPVAGE